MSVIHQHPSIDWQQIAQALHEQRCVLLLGPDVCCDFKKATPEPMTRELAMHLSQNIENHNDTFQLINNSTLSYVTAAYETSFIDKVSGIVKDSEYGRAKCREAVREFYTIHKARQFAFYKKLASLPFHIIINTNHYDFFNKALTSVNKEAQTHYFNYKNPIHNHRLNFESPTADKPLVYNLFGRIDDIESLVLTEADQIFFAENIVQKEATATLPTDLRALLLRKKKNVQEEYIFLFVGFDFQEWHLRILLHFLFNRQDTQQKYTAIALQKPDDIDPLTHFLYEKHFSVDFYQTPPLGFLNRLEKQFSSPQPLVKPKRKSGKRLFIMNHPNEDHLREELDVALTMLKRNKVISEIQSSADITHGIVAEQMQQLITEADIVVLIVTNKFLADDKLYQYLPLALERHHAGEARVIPVIMSYCAWKDSNVELQTMLPPNGDPIRSKQPERDKDLMYIANEIEKTIKYFQAVI